MKTLFQSGFAAQRRFWMGISSINPMTLDDAMDTYAKVQGWLASVINPRDTLGTDADNFQTTNTEIRGLYDDVVAINQKAHANQDLSDDEVTKANAFVRDAEFLWTTIQAHPALPTPTSTAPPTSTTPVTPATTTASNPAAQANPPAPGQPTKPTKTPTGAAKPAAAPAASGPDYTPLLIGGGIVGALLLVIVATK